MSTSNLAVRSERRKSVAFHQALVRTGVVALTAFLAAGPAVAQGQAAADDGQQAGEAVEEVLVTGTRIVRDGYSTPTPVSVLGAEALDSMGVTNVADAVNRLPVFAASVTSRNSSASVSSGTAGINNLNLRGLGPTRTLVLLNGKRVVGSTLAGFDNNGSAVDINSFPNALIERVEVVTGGASAVYGSDALAGVVNFILDTDYTGIKGEVIGGVTSQGDGENYRGSIAAGMPFADGRGHILFSAEHSYEEGIDHIPRSWADTAYQMIVNPNYSPTNGQPQYLTVFDAGLSVATRGGLILACQPTGGGACPLRGTQFLTGGTPADFQFGPIISGVVMSGGDWETSRIDRELNLSLDLERNTFFTRGSYDVGDATTAFVTLMRSRTVADLDHSVPNFNLGGVTVLSGNPFIPDSVQAAMTAHGIPSFTMGTVNGDMPNLQADNQRTFERYVVGLEGDVEALGSNWVWDTYYGYSRNEIIATSPGNRINANYAKAINAVVNPNNGQVVCAVNIDGDPTNDDPACVPYNPMGIGVNSQAAIDYVTGAGYALTLMEQKVFAASASGEPFSNWAGPVSLAFGAEHRKEQVSGVASALDEADAFFAGNYHASQGEYDVTEGFLETVVPLLSDQPLAESLDFNGAVRVTDYSESGEVTTWKLGTTWTPSEDILFRVTRSRDIRAPNLGDLFNAGRSGTGTVFDPFTGTTATIISRIRGNTNLEPEEADTTGIGVVFTPSFLPGFAMSVDYYDIDISGAITTLDTQEIVDRCFEGLTELCSFIGRNQAGFIDRIAVLPANILSQRASGFDIDARYTFPVGNADMTLRAMATYVNTLETVDQESTVDGAGVNAADFGFGGEGLQAPDLTYLVSAAYQLYPFSATLTARGISDGVYNNALIECVPGTCPPATPLHPTTNNNSIDAVTYFDLTLSYTGMDGAMEAFFVVENLLDEDPPLIAGPVGTGFYAGQGNAEFYDRLGRIFRAGMRFSF